MQNEKTNMNNTTHEQIEKKETMMREPFSTAFVRVVDPSPFPTYVVSNIQSAPVCEAGQRRQRDD